MAGFVSLWISWSFCHLFVATLPRNDRSGYWRLHSVTDIAGKQFEWTLRLATSQALATTVRHGILAQLGKKRSVSVSDLLENVNDRSSLTENKILVLLRLLSAEGIVEESPLHHFRFREDGEAFKEHSYLVDYFLNDGFWQAWAHLDGLSPFEEGNGGLRIDEYYSNHSSVLKAANKLVERVSNWERQMCLENIDWSDYGSVTDLGGNEGQIMEVVKNVHPKVLCNSLDLPAVVERAVANGRARGVELIPGDLFNAETYPKSDLLFMKHIIMCEFGEEDSLKILRECRKVKPSNVVVAECILADSNEERRKNLLPFALDAMMLIDGTRYRSMTVAEWEIFAREAGFQVEKVIHTDCPTCSLLYMKPT